ncbi:hypothetical protein [Photobacterium leiognathi]|uniref:hypothetical protein n=1 Tax=Photobacterium leiognathi TaxID=553611 RepID=UPI003DA12FE5
MSDDFYFKVSVYDGEFRDILFEVNDEVSHFPDNIIDMKNDIEKLLKTLGILFRNDLSSYDYYYDRIFLLADLAFNGKRD